MECSDCIVASSLEVESGRLLERLMAVRTRLFMALALAISTSAQNNANCDAGTPIPFNDNGAWGYATASGVTVPPQFTLAQPFPSGIDVAVVCKAEGCGLINTKGFVTPLREKSAANLALWYSEGVGVVVKDGNWGYVDFAGSIVIALKFRYAGTFDRGMALVLLDDKFFFINHKGERVTPEFAQAYHFSGELAAVQVGDKIGYIRRDGTFALPPQYKGSSGIDFSEGLVAFRSDGKVGFMDDTGAIVVNPGYDDAYPFSEGLAMVRLGDSWGYINKTGKMVIPPNFQITNSFNEGVASVYLADTKKVGYIDHSGTFVLPAIFDAAMPFCAGLAYVETFRRIGPDPNDLLRRERFQGKHGLIDHTGKYVWRDPEERIWTSRILY